MSEVSTVSPAAVSAPRTLILSPREALQRAWTSFIVMMIAPFLLFLAVLSQGGGAASSPLALIWAGIAMAAIAVGLPAAFFVRSRLFKDYWEGKVVSPKDYLRGMMTIWLTLEIIGVFSLLGCIVTGSLVPCMVPALLAFMFFAPFWPSGDAMVNAVGASDDAEVFKHPR
jgi:hypothetical protein